MKKLILFAATVALAFAGQAAAVSWSNSLVGQGEAFNGNGAFVLAFAGSDYASIVKLVTVDGSDTLQADLAAKAIGTATFANNRGVATTAATRTSDAPSSMFWMIFKDGSYDAGKAVAWTAVTDVTSYQYDPPASGTTLALNASSYANNGTIASVPEPTSAMLLLVGMAGLALRRRRA